MLSLTPKRPHAQPPTGAHPGSHPFPGTQIGAGAHSSTPTFAYDPHSYPPFGFGHPVSTTLPTARGLFDTAPPAPNRRRLPLTTEVPDPRGDGTQLTQALRVLDLIQQHSGGKVHRPKTFFDFCRTPGFTFPDNFRYPKIPPYKGDSDPDDWLAVFCESTRPYADQPGLVIYLMQRSLEGTAQTWFNSLKAEQLKDINIILHEFRLHLRDQVAYVPTIIDLQEAAGAGEDFIS